MALGHLAADARARARPPDLAAQAGNSGAEASLLSCSLNRAKEAGQEWSLGAAAGGGGGGGG